MHFVHEVRDEELAGSADNGVGRFHAVDDDPILGAARAVDRDPTELPLVVGRRRLRCERREVAAPRQLLDLFVAEVRGTGALRHGDHGRLADDFDRFVGPRWLEHQIDGELNAEHQVDVDDASGEETGEPAGHLIAAWRQRRETIDAGSIGDGLQRETAGAVRQ